MEPDTDLQLQIDHAIAPCVLHRYHSPTTIVNELHHIFPVYLQKRVWGEVRDKERQPICSTGHNSVHWVLQRLLSDRSVPWWRIGRSTKKMACEALTRYQEAVLVEQAQPTQHNRRAEDK